MSLASKAKLAGKAAAKAGSAVSGVAKSKIFSGNHSAYVAAAHDAGKQVPILGRAAHWTKPGWNNFFSGVELNRRVDAGLAVGAIGLGAAIGAKEGTFDQSREGIIAGAQQAGNIPRMSADGIGYGMAPPQRNLGASGDIVFGLHNSRKGR